MDNKGKLRSCNKCKICGQENTKVIYQGAIREGGIGVWTQETIPVYQCSSCGVIWHDNLFNDIDEYYEGEDYRNQVNGDSSEDRFYELHDGESMDKFRYTGTKIFRNKVVADIGCGCGAWLDLIKGMAKESIGVEPSTTYRDIMRKKGIATFPYLKDALQLYRKRCNVVTSFDVIEHVEDPFLFMQGIYELLSDGGEAIIGTPTDTPVMRKLLGETYEKMILFTAQHLWIFSVDSLKLLAQSAGFSSFRFRCFQTYDMTNLLAWLQYKEPLSIGGNFGHPKRDVDYDFVTESMNAVYKSELEKNFLGDYFVTYLKK